MQLQFRHTVTLFSTSSVLPGNNCLSYHYHNRLVYKLYGYILPWSDYLLKMRLVVFLLLLLLLVGCLCDIRVLIDQNGRYNITVNNTLWLRSSRTAIYADDLWYSTDNNSLPLVSITTAQGTDPYLGNWNETKLTYNLIRNQSTTSVVAHIRQWSMVPAFTFYLETGDTTLTNTIPLEIDQIRTVFPSFYIEKTNINDQRGYITIGGKL